MTAVKLVYTGAVASAHHSDHPAAIAIGDVTAAARADAQIAFYLSVPTGEAAGIGARIHA